MKRRSADRMGNFFMGLGLVVMIGGVGYSIIAEVSQFNLPQFFAHGAIMSIFVGALLWLVGRAYRRPRAGGGSLLVGKTL